MFVPRRSIPGADWPDLIQANESDVAALLNHAVSVDRRPCLPRGQILLVAGRRRPDGDLPVQRIQRPTGPPSLFVNKGHNSCPKGRKVATEEESRDNLQLISWSE